MNNTVYFVTWYIHNQRTNEWNASVVDQFTSYSAALKEYYNQLSMYIDGAEFDVVNVFLTNSAGGIEESSSWMSTES